MADRVDFYFRQRVTEAELDLACELLEQADRDLAADIGIYGIVTGAVPTQHSPSPAWRMKSAASRMTFSKVGDEVFYENAIAAERAAILGKSVPASTTSCWIRH